jgi:SagB-type dehydrogenase family enzyme
VVRYRRSANLVAYWDLGCLLVRNFATGAELFVSAEHVAVLNSCSRWRTASDVVIRSRLRRAVVRQSTKDLVAAGFLLRSDRAASVAERRMRRWAAWNPAAGFFHAASRDQPFRSLTDAQTELQMRAGRRPWPGPVYKPPGAARVKLPRPRAAAPVLLPLLQRRSWRQFKDGVLRGTLLSDLLWLTGGIQKWVRTSVGTFALKTSPSGGALHPVELYVLVRRVQGFAPGFYHYSGVDHALRRLRRHPRVGSIDHYLPEQPWFEGAAAVVFLVAHYDRYLWKYDYPRAYRGPLVEAGHLAQTFCVTATALGLAPFVSMALADSRIEREIGADGIARAVLYAAGVGLRPDGVDSAPTPEGVRPSKIRPNRIGSRR